jgi:hypothetical protein
MAAFDRLPAVVRHALWEAVVEWDPRQSRWDINKRIKRGMPEHLAVAIEVEEIRSADEREVKAFQYHWPSRFGRYPHVAADATIMRYNERPAREVQAA